MTATSRPQGWRFFAATAAVVAAVATWLLAMGHAEARPESPSPASHPAHALATSLGSEFTIDTDHAHLDKPSSAARNETFAIAVVPNLPATAVATLGVVVAAITAVRLLWQQVMLVGRSPPRGLTADLTGQDLLTRLSVSRR